MPFCNKCGTEVPGGAGFCHSCGTPIGISGGNNKTDKPLQEDDAFKTVVRQKPAYGVVNLENLPEGHIIDDRYEVKEKVGQGGFGAVYRVYDRKMKIEKALKVLPEVVASDREAMENISKEATTMARLNHPNIVRVYDFQDKGTIKYIDMEYVDGKNLTDIKLDSPAKKLTEEIVKKIGQQIVKGLSYAHKENVIHRDIKPQNILLSQKTGVKIMDFGISETVRSSMSRMENSGSSGTLAYMSPEQLKGKDVGREADIYSFGCLLYELLSGKPPFHKGDLQYQILNEKPVQINDISESMNAFLLKCLEKEYTDRYRDFEEVLVSLEGNAPAKPYSRVGTAHQSAPQPLKNSTTSKETTSKTKSAMTPKLLGGIFAGIVLIICLTLFAMKDDSKESVTGAASADRRQVAQKNAKKVIAKKSKSLPKGTLYVKTVPSNARVRILNIKPKFEQGIELEPGKYHIAVSANGYETKKSWIELNRDETKNLTVTLMENENTIRIGVAGAHSGDLGSYGLPTINAVAIVTKEINQRGGLLGKQIELVIEDDLCKTDLAERCAEKMVSENVAGVIGHICSNATKAALNTYNANDVVCISPSATNIDLTLSGHYPNFFRTIVNDAAQAKSQASFAINNLNVKKVALIHDRGDYGKGSVNLVKKFFDRSGRVDIVLFEGVENGDENYSAIVKKIKISGAELVVWGGYAIDASRLITQMRTKNMTTLMIASDGVKDEQFIRAAGIYAEGVYVTGLQDNSIKAMYSRVQKKHQVEYGEEPGPFYYNAYAAILSLVNAIEKAGNTRYEDVVKALKSEYVNTPIGKIGYDNHGDVKGGGFVMYQVKNKSFVTVN